jgi:hypothetical protein
MESRRPEQAGGQARTAVQRVRVGRVRATGDTVTATGAGKQEVMSGTIRKAVNNQRTILCRIPGKKGLPVRATDTKNPRVRGPTGDRLQRIQVIGTSILDGLHYEYRVLVNRRRHVLSNQRTYASRRSILRRRGGWPRIVRPLLGTRPGHGIRGSSEARTSGHLVDGSRWWRVPR